MSLSCLKNRRWKRCQQLDNWQIVDLCLVVSLKHFVSTAYNNRARQHISYMFIMHSITHKTVALFSFFLRRTKKRALLHIIQLNLSAYAVNCAFFLLFISILVLCVYNVYMQCVWTANKIRFYGFDILFHFIWLKLLYIFITLLL